jgi:AcrR family transcriptional regulator
MTPAIRNRMTAAQRRAAIVETAIDLFSKHGFRGTTTRELAAAVGVSEPVLYQHFETKRALYEAIIESQSLGEVEKVVPELRALSEAGDNRAYFTRLAGLLLDWHLKDPRYCRLLMFSGLENHELSRLFYERCVAVFYELVTQHLDREVKKGVFREVDSLLTARSFVGMVVHHGTIFAIHCPGALQGSRDGIVETVVSIFLNGISK